MIGAMHFSGRWRSSGVRLGGGLCCWTLAGTHDWLSRHSFLGADTVIRLRCAWAYQGCMMRVKHAGRKRRCQGGANQRFSGATAYGAGQGANSESNA